MPAGRPVGPPARRLLRGRQERRSQWGSGHVVAAIQEAEHSHHAQDFQHRFFGPARPHAFAERLSVTLGCAAAASSKSSAARSAGAQWALQWCCMSGPTTAWPPRQPCRAVPFEGQLRTDMADDTDKAGFATAAVMAKVSYHLRWLPAPIVLRTLSDLLPSPRQGSPPVAGSGLGAARPSSRAFRRSRSFGWQ